MSRLSDAELWHAFYSRIEHDDQDKTIGLRAVADAAVQAERKSYARQSIKKIAVQAAVDAAVAAERDDAYREACYLATAIYKRRYMTQSPRFELCPDTVGVITQIDNMVAGLFSDIESVQAEREGREAVAWCTPDGERCVTAKTMNGARRDGGAMLSSMAPFTVAAYTTPPAAPVVPEGWRLVPEKATLEMLQAAQLAPIPAVYTDSISGNERLRIDAIYRAMLSAAPQPMERDQKLSDNLT